ncbi:MAG TPA: hypothetical protein VMX97_13735 [Hyphomicrobiaceae bacterium]|nr:hypothetical protein [Hyphomicrobiaceae bacterium]HUU74336.1 hypothetical protein [Burkholderiales bacterium]
MKFGYRFANPALVPAIVLVIFLSPEVMADGTVVDKVYHPYVQPLEREVELRGIVQQDDDDEQDGLQVSRLGIGGSWSEWVSSEVYVIGKSTNEQGFKVNAYEFETKWQLTEQGEYWADWGLLFELEKERDPDVWEYATRMVILKEWNQWVTTANLSLIYEWGDDIANEWETELALQGRYRLMRSFEPALEFYSGQNYKGLGPVFMGDVRAGQKSRLHWEIGVIFGIDSDSADRTYRGLLEFEF